MGIPPMISAAVRAEPLLLSSGVLADWIATAFACFYHHFIRCRCYGSDSTESISLAECFYSIDGQDQCIRNLLIAHALFTIYLNQCFLIICHHDTSTFRGHYL
nr:MAG TPA_asm: hypothetical protein [Caudoviricetes sp.]